MSVPARTIVLVCAWTCFGATAAIAWLGVQARVNHHRVLTPQPSTAEIVPFDACEFHGPCRVVYVTPLVARIDSIAISTVVAWAALSVVGCVAIVAMGNWTQKHKKPR